MVQGMSFVHIVAIFDYHLKLDYPFNSSTPDP